MYKGLKKEFRNRKIFVHPVYKIRELGSRGSSEDEDEGSKNSE